MFRLNICVSIKMEPETQYAQAGPVSIAYQVFGDGPVDLVIVPGWVSNLDTFWEEPSVARFFDRLGTFARVILFDKRGTGLSDRVTQSPTLEERMDDVRAVLDAVGEHSVAPVRAVPGLSDLPCSNRGFNNDRFLSNKPKYG